jgi:hypothetical protein
MVRFLSSVLIHQGSRPNQIVLFQYFSGSLKHFSELLIWVGSGPLAITYIEPGNSPMNGRADHFHITNDKARPEGWILYSCSGRVLYCTQEKR